jgi:hypothetical protein
LTAGRSPAVDESRQLATQHGVADTVRLTHNHLVAELLEREKNANMTPISATATST